jgi:nucleoid-associated protein YgaU
MRVDALIVFIVFVLMTLATALTRCAPHPEHVVTAVVQRGDTLWGMSAERRNGADPREWIYRAYQLNPGLKADGLRPGQVLQVPDWR